jgi:septal ring factor EnvC (AmiA/AmiB activator)
MTPEAYLRQYTESFLPAKAESGLSPDTADLTLEQGYYYPPYLQQEAYLDTLSRADLLGIAQQILGAEYPQQRLTRRQVDEYLETLRRLKNERGWLQTEMERLNGEMVSRIDELASCGVERQRLESRLADCRGRLALLENECATLRGNLTDLHGSTSWKVTAPLRKVSRMLRALRGSDD